MRTFAVAAGSKPFGIAPGPDGALWYTQLEAGRIGRITISGQVTDFPLPTARSMPSVITLGGDGALWFTLNQADAVGQWTGGPAIGALGTVSSIRVALVAATACLLPAVGFLRSAARHGPAEVGVPAPSGGAE